MRLSFRIRYAITLSIRTFFENRRASRFGREIRKAYGVPFFQVPDIDEIPQIAADHPYAALALPASVLLLAAALYFGPGPGAVFPAFKAKRAPAPPAIREAERTEPARPRPPAGEFRFTLLADKAGKRLFLCKYFKSGEYAIAREYPIAIGERPGRKRRRGDLRTPEGLYWIIGIREDRELPPIYGIRAFVLDYPNAQDVLEKRTGRGIWIHGTERGKAPDKTKGCLELDNGRLDELSGYIGIGTPVFIADTLASFADSVKKYFQWDVLERKQRAPAGDLAAQ
jgi:hypothetical protein